RLSDDRKSRPVIPFQSNNFLAPAIILEDNVVAICNKRSHGLELECLSDLAANFPIAVGCDTENPKRILGTRVAPVLIFRHCDLGKPSLLSSYNMRASERTRSRTRGRNPRSL